ncbi:MAG: hypothetical protein HOW73_49450 [Polyangiaceae bacterium]|nr:hypothetical protein [Polyangiaceae bacterium]
MMATFLTTSKMNPALAARVEKSVHGGRATSPAATRRLIALARVAAVAGLAIAIWIVVTGRRRDRADTENVRAELVARAEANIESVTTSDRDLVTRAESWLGALSDPDYRGDFVAEELRPAGALAAALSRPALYVRGPMQSFGNYEQLADTAASSKKDALLLCLLRPPASRAEKAVYEQVKIAYFDGPGLEERTSNARRLHDALAGLPFLQAAFADRVRAAQSDKDLKKIRTELDRAPVDAAKVALKSELLLVAIDEPGDGKGPTELDGAQSHFVRLALVDLHASTVLFSLRRHVDPSWISSEKRPTYASGLDGCALGFDVHEQIARQAGDTVATEAVKTGSR